MSVIEKLREGLAQQMKAKNVKGAELARRMGVSRVSVYQLLRGPHEPRLSTIVSAYEALDCTLDLRVRQK